MIIKFSDVEAYGGHTHDFSQRNISPDKEYIIQEKIIGHNTAPNELVISSVNCSVNLYLDATDRNGTSNNIARIKIPLFKFKEFGSSEIVDDDSRYVIINDEYFIMTHITMVSKIRKNIFDMSSLYMVNREIFGIDWKEWIKTTGYDLHVNLT